MSGVESIIFLGPTLPSEAARAEIDALFLPPVSQGDVYRVTGLRPRAIGIIDGYFNQVPAVWHKEILWAMSQGVHVFGSASMGALRAAELTAFGMEGVGWVFEAYRDGLLEDDDEVAVVHGLPIRGQYMPFSEPMVNIRRTLGRAEADGVVSASTRRILERIAKDLFYPERAYPTVVGRAREEGAPAPELDAFEAWLPVGRVDQKRDDAVAMLRVMKARLAADPAPKQVHFTFERTELWEEACRRAGTLRLDPDGAAGSRDVDAGSASDTGPVFADAVLDELRLEGAAYARERDSARLHWLLLAEARRRGIAPDEELVCEAIVDLRRRHGLLQAAALEQWMREQQLTADDLTRLLVERTRADTVAALVDEEAGRTLVDRLRLTGDYARFYERARHKAATLRTRGLDGPLPRPDDVTAERLLQWFCAERLGRPPEPPEVLARECGFASESAFWRALRRESLYSECTRDTATRPGARRSSP